LAGDESSRPHPLVHCGNLRNKGAKDRLGGGLRKAISGRSKPT